MAKKSSLDDENGTQFSFALDQLIYIGYDPKSQKIVICVQGFPPRYLPLTLGNLQYLHSVSAYLEIQSGKNAKIAVDDLLKSAQDSLARPR